MTDHPSNTPEPQFEFLIKDGVIWFGVPLKFFYEHPEVFGAPYNTVAKKDTNQPTGLIEPISYNVVESTKFYDSEQSNAWYWKK